MLSGGSSAVEQRTVKCASAAILWSGVQISLSGFLEVFGTRCAGVPRDAVQMSYGHTTVKAPHPIRTAKLSTVGPDQYYGRGLRGNLRCCKAYFIFFHACTFWCSCTRAVHQGYWRNRKRACLASTRYWDRNPDTPVRYGVVGNISACHADARGSIPRFGVLHFLQKIFFHEKKSIHARI